MSRLPPAALADATVPDAPLTLALLRIEASRARLRTAMLPPADSAASDGGPGFAEDVLAHAFEPYVTTKAKGTGLGLAIVKKIIDEHGGRVVLDNVQPTGARVTLHFPALPAAKPAAAAA